MPAVFLNIKVLFTTHFLMNLTKSHKFKKLIQEKMNRHFETKLQSLLIFACLQTSTNAAQILGIFPIASRSHFMYNQAILECLAEAGHSITVVTPFPKSLCHDNFTYIHLKQEKRETKNWDFRNIPWQEMLEIGLEEFEEKDCYDFMKIKSIQMLLDKSSKKYDLIFVEMLPMYECYLPIAKKFAIPVIGTIAMRHWSHFCSHLRYPHPFIDPFIVSENPTRMSLYQRFKNILDHCYFKYFYNFKIPPKLDTFFKVHFSTYDATDDNILSLLFTNSHSSVFSSKTVPTVLEIGGIQIKPAKPLPLNLQKFIDEANSGVILFTLGSFTSTQTLEPKLISLFLTTFARLPQRIIWKFDGEIANVPKNVLLSKWLPQRDILAHKNVKAFITHSGMNGAYEAIAEAKPLIMIPLFGDQLSNAALLEEHGVGVRLNIESLTKEELLGAITKILTDKRYIERMNKLSKAFNDRPMTPKQTVVYWTEYVLRHNGTSHLKPVVDDMPFYSYFLLDVISVLLITVLVITYMLYFSVQWVYHRLMMPKKVDKPVKTD